MGGDWLYYPFDSSKFELGRNFTELPPRRDNIGESHSIEVFFLNPLCFGENVFELAERMDDTRVI